MSQIKVEDQQVFLAEQDSPDKTVQNDAPHGVGVTLFLVRDFALNSSQTCAFGGVDGEGTDVILWVLWQHLGTNFLLHLRGIWNTKTFY